MVEHLNLFSTLQMSTGMKNKTTPIVLSYEASSFITYVVASKHCMNNARNEIFKDNHFRTLEK